MSEGSLGQVKLGRVGGARMRASQLREEVDFILGTVGSLEAFKQVRMGFDSCRGDGRSVSKG